VLAASGQTFALTSRSEGAIPSPAAKAGGAAGGARRKQKE